VASSRRFNAEWDIGREMGISIVGGGFQKNGNDSRTGEGEKITYTTGTLGGNGLKKLLQTTVLRWQENSKVRKS